MITFSKAEAGGRGDLCPAVALGEGAILPAQQGQLFRLKLRDAGKAAFGPGGKAPLGGFQALQDAAQADIDDLKAKGLQRAHPKPLPAFGQALNGLNGQVA